MSRRLKRAFFISLSSAAIMTLIGFILGGEFYWQGVVGFALGGFFGGYYIFPYRK
ncbi:hypothetical protein MKX54_03785 [Alkalihalobacillus sp. FSL R5-0424]